MPQRALKYSRFAEPRANSEPVVGKTKFLFVKASRTATWSCETARKLFQEHLCQFAKSRFYRRMYPPAAVDPAEPNTVRQVTVAAIDTAPHCLATTDLRAFACCLAAAGDIAVEGDRSLTVDKKGTPTQK
jgi:hypothetical protein